VRTRMVSLLALLATGMVAFETLPTINKDSVALRVRMRNEHAKKKKGAAPRGGGGAAPSAVGSGTSADAGSIVAAVVTGSGGGVDAQESGSDDFGYSSGDVSDDERAALRALKEIGGDPGEVY